MITKAAQSVLTKIFVGCALGPDLRIQLNQSATWKQSRILVGQDPAEPAEVRFNNKDYLGFQVDGTICPWPILQEKKHLVNKALSRYIPHHNSETLKIHIFSQIFVA